MADDHLIEITADIVAAHLSNNMVAVGNVANLVQQVYASVAGLGAPAEPQAQEKREPVVSARTSVKPDHIVCMICGTRNKLLKRHLQTAHGMTPAEYRSEFGLRADYPMVAPDYSSRRKELAHSTGLGLKRRTPEAAASAEVTGSMASKTRKPRRRKDDAAPAPDEQPS